MAVSQSARGRGQALVEFALVLPILLLLIFGIIDAGRLIYAYNTVSNSARNAARVAIVNQSTAGTDTCDTLSATAWSTGCAIQSGVGLGITPTDVNVVYRDPTDTAACPSPPTIGCLAVVKVTGRFQPLTPVIGQLIGPIALTSTSKVPVERVCNNNPPPAPLPNC
jgi:Flp pilus assembly protein TadG